MKNTRSRLGASIFGATIILQGFSAPVLGETHIVKLYTYDATVSDKSNFFDPPLIKIAKGDTVHFQATQPTHNASFKKGMLPDGAPEWIGPLDTDFEVTFDIEGTYGYICAPHYSSGMVGIVLVGDYHINLADARKAKQRGKAKSVFRALFKDIDALP